jgi:hypothetical protein
MSSYIDPHTAAPTPVTQLRAENLGRSQARHLLLVESLI